MSEETTTTEKKPRGKMWLVKILAISAVALAVAVDVGIRAFKYFRHTPAAQASAPGAPPSDGHGGGEPKKSEAKSTMNLDAFLVNLADKEAARFLKVTLRLGLDDEKLGEELAKEGVALAITRDSIISVLSAKTADEITTPEGKEKLRKEIRTKVNAVLPKGQVTDVFLVDFVVQF